MAEEGYDNVVFCRISADGGMTVPWSKMPTGYAEVYRRYNLQQRDPVLARAPLSTGALDWLSLEGESLTEAERDMLEMSRAMGVHSGVSIPFHAPDGACDVFSLSLDSSPRPDPTRLPYVEAKTYQAWRRYWDIVGGGLRGRAMSLQKLPRAYYWAALDGRCGHRGGPPGMLAAHCRTLMYVDLAARRREMGLADVSNDLSLNSQEPDLVFLAKWGLIVETTRKGRPGKAFVPSVLGHNHLATCPAAAKFRGEIWSLDIRRGERPKVD